MVLVLKRVALGKKQELDLAPPLHLHTVGTIVLARRQKVWLAIQIHVQVGVAVEINSVVDPSIFPLFSYLSENITFEALSSSLFLPLIVRAVLAVMMSRQITNFVCYTYLLYAR